MALQHLLLERITAEDLARLVDLKVRESALVDYKQAFALGTDEQKREFLFDVASFANSAGGDLIYGIKAADGVPTEVVGLAEFIPDKEQLRMEDMLRASISPRLNGVGFQTVTAPNGRPVLIVRVPRSLAAPHLVKIGSLSRFYGRNSAGKYELDVTEIRRSFLASEGVFTRLRDFRIERLHRIIRNDVGVKFTGVQRLVLHVIPVATLREELTFSLPQLQKAGGSLRPFGQISGWGPRFNFDGVLVESTANNQTTISSIQLFRNGAVEVVDATSLQYWEDKPILPVRMAEQAIREGFAILLEYLQRLGPPAPYVVGLSLLNVRDRIIYRGPQFSFGGVTPISQDHLILPEITIESLPADVDAIFRPLFDLIWNASGFSRCHDYDEQGKWNPRN